MQKLTKDNSISLLPRWSKDGRIFYTLGEDSGEFSHWYYDPNTGEHHAHFLYIYGETRDCFRIYTDKGYRFITKQDWYNENYDAAF